jgi:hypothetical protein
MHRTALRVAETGHPRWLLSHLAGLTVLFWHKGRVTQLCEAAQNSDDKLSQHGSDRSLASLFYSFWRQTLALVQPVVWSALVSNGVAECRHYMNVQNGRHGTYRESVDNLVRGVNKR